MNDRDRAYFGSGEEDRHDRVPRRATRAIFRPSYAAEQDVLVDQLAKDEAIAEADTLLLTVPNQWASTKRPRHVEAILKHVAPGLGWR